MIQDFADWLIYDVAGLGADSHLGSALNFFVYDSLKILLLLFLISALIGIFFGTITLFIILLGYLFNVVL